MLRHLTPFKSKYVEQPVVEREIILSPEERILNHFPPEFDPSHGIIYGMEQFMRSDATLDYNKEIIFWSDDHKSISKTAYLGNPNFCNRNLSGDQTKPHRYMCSFSIMCYKLSSLMLHPNARDRVQRLQDFDFTIQTPEWTPEPYKYVHYTNIYGRRMNLFNMYLCYLLTERLEQAYQNWIVRRFDEPIKRNNKTLGQITTMIQRPVRPSLSNVKLQMCIKPEYFFWVIETLYRNVSTLDELGVLNFKICFLHGEFELTSLMEMFPFFEDGDDIPTYTIPGDPTIYKRELLTQSNIIIYLKQQPISDLIHYLIHLFPDKYKLSYGISRFNIRLSENVSFSVGGNNEDKYNHIGGSIPQEYAELLEDNTGNSISERLTGHTLIHHGEPNPIRSYYRIIETPSFRESFEMAGLMEFYPFESGMFVGGKTRRKRRVKKSKKK